MPLRQPELPPHHAGAQAPLTPCPTASTCSGAPRRCGSSSNRCCPASASRSWHALESTNTRLLDRARQHSGLRDAPVTRPGQIDDGSQPADAPSPYGRRAVDTHPCLLVAEHQTAAAAASVATGRPRPGAR